MWWCASERWRQRLQLSVVVLAAVAVVLLSACSRDSNAASGGTGTRDGSVFRNLGKR